MSFVKRLVVVSLCFAVAVWADGNSFDRVRYNGGSLNSKVDPQEWHNHLIVTPDMITLALKDGTSVQILPKAVTNLSYGQEAHRRVGTMIALAILVGPIALFGYYTRHVFTLSASNTNSPMGKRMEYFSKATKTTIERYW